MTSARRRGLAAAALAGLLVLGGCGSGDDAAPSADATPSAATASVTAPADADGFTAEEREVLNAIKAYYDAVLLRGAESIETTLKGVVTEKVFTAVVAHEKKHIEEKGLQYLGPYTFAPSSFFINGDRADVRGCLDRTSSFIVKRGATEPAADSEAGTRAEQRISLERVDGRWGLTFLFDPDVPC